MNKNTTASLDVHAQKTFTPLCPNELPVPDGHLIAEALNEQATFARLRIGAKEAHHPDACWVAKTSQEQFEPVEGHNVDIKWLPHSMTGTTGFELIDGLPAIAEYDYYVWQGVELDMHPYGVCYHDQHDKLSTGVIEFLHQNNINTIIVGGLATDYCVKTSVLQLCRAGFTVFVNLSACRGIAADTSFSAIEQMQQAGAHCIDDLSQLPS